MFGIYNFETQLNLDSSFMDVETPQKGVSNTMITNSPTSEFSPQESFSHSLNPSLDNSFEEGAQLNHANGIFDASISLFNNTMKGSDSQTGFNNPTVYPTGFSFQAEANNIDEAIKGNRLLRFGQKANFIEELQKEDELSHLLMDLMVLFNQKVFGEIVYVIHTIWNKKYLNFREAKKSTANIIPTFKAFFNFYGLESQKEEVSMNFTDT